MSSLSFYEVQQCVQFVTAAICRDNELELNLRGARLREQVIDKADINAELNGGIKQ